MARVCAECGHVNESATDYCLYCGAPLGFGPGEPFAEVGESRDTWRVFGIASPLVGREAELEAVLDAVRSAASSGEASLVLVTGAEGMGKSRFLDALNAALVAEYPDALMPRSSARGQGEHPYAPLASLLEDRFYVPRGADPALAAERLSSGIRSLIGDARGADAADRITAMLGLGGRVREGVRDEVERGWRRALVDVFRADASNQLLVLAFDDIDVAGAETRALVRELVPAMSDVPTVVVATAKSDEVRAEFESALGEGSCVTVALSPLTDAAIATLTRAILERVDEVPDAIVERVCAAAMGNPLVAEEAVRILIREGVVDTRGNRWTLNPARLDQIALPGQVEDMVRARLERLSEDERRLLGDAALMGETFWLGGLVVLERARREGAVDVDAIEWDDAPAAIAAALDALARRDIVRANTASALRGEREFTFKHWVERRLHAERVQEPWRGRAHRLLAQWLQVRSVAEPEPFLVAIAEHSAVGGMRGPAAEFFGRAGRLCRDRYVNDRAAQHLERALELFDEEDYLQRADTLLDLGALYALDGRHEDAVAAYEGAAACAWRVGSGRRQALALEGLGRAYRRHGEYDRALDLLGRALGRFESLDDQAGIAQTLDNLGRIHWIRGQYDKAEAEYERALEIRRSLGDARALAVSLSHIGTLLVYRGQFTGALQRFREALDIRRREGDLSGIADSLNTIGYIFAERGDGPSAARIWAEAVDVARDAGDRALEATVLNNLGESDLMVGDLAAAEKHLGEACELAERIGERRVVFDTIRNLGVLQARKGNLGLALDHADEALDLAKALKSRAMEGVALRTLAELRGQTVYDDSEDGQGNLAEAAFRSAIEIFRELGLEAELGRTYHSYGTYLVEQRLLVQGKKHLEMAREIFQRLEMRKILAQTEATIDDL